MTFVTGLRQSTGNSADLLELDDEDMTVRYSSLAPLNEASSGYGHAANTATSETAYGHTNNRNNLLNSLFTSWSPPQTTSTAMTTPSNTHQHHHDDEENDGENGASANGASILRRIKANFGRNASDNSYKGGWGTSVFDLDQSHRNGGGSSSTVISPDTTTAVTMTSGSGIGADDDDGRKELSFSRMAATLISSSSSHPPDSQLGFGDRIRKLNETTSFELSSRLPRVMSLVDPQGSVKGPLSLTLSSQSASSTSLGSEGSDSLMLGDESDLSAVTTSLPLDFFNTSFFNDTEWGNDTTIDPGAGNYNYFALLLIIFPLVAMFGNVLVILSVKRERSLWNVTNYFIVSLAVADLLVAAVVMPFAVYFLVSKKSFPFFDSEHIFHK
ncbi:Dopamine D2-like receptor [Orchesella cincta]|uniref:Dopamine D2-like receptor n=1 Tax=Orchesella cincta TaxID=48709 RepID=A0A1D2MG02_ORCCI|nr:Dopamine D2-like receptor [Orchesella cincta]